MNSKVVIAFEVILIIIYLILVVFIFDTATTLGLIEVGVLTAILFPLIIVMEKKREASVAVETPTEDSQPVEGQTPQQPDTTTSQAPLEPASQAPAQTQEQPIATQQPPTQQQSPGQPPVQ
jgi:hypothetical protein